MAIGQGSGREGPLEAARQAIANRLLNLSIDDGRGILFSVKGGRQLTLGGVTAAGELIAKTVKRDAQIFFGMCVDHSLEDTVKLTLMATGLPQNSSKEVTEKYALQDKGTYTSLEQNGHQETPETPPVAPKKKRGWWK
jgi:cell division protein FtsZ